MHKTNPHSTGARIDTQNREGVTLSEDAEEKTGGQTLLLFIYHWFDW